MLQPAKIRSELLLKSGVMYISQIHYIFMPYYLMDQSDLIHCFIIIHLFWLVMQLRVGNITFVSLRINPLKLTLFFFFYVYEIRMEQKEHCKFYTKLHCVIC